MRRLRQSDARLVKRAAGGDEAAFAEIFARYGQDLYRYCRAILGNPTDAEDALQNTMARVLRALPGERRSLALRPWLFRVARNESISMMRVREDNAELSESAVAAGPAPDIMAEHREAVRTLVSDLAALPEVQRTALVLHELNGLSHEEISEAMQRSPRASRQAIYEARLALQDSREGREMECDRVRALISEGDGRVLRGRKVKAHLRGCDTCSSFRLAIQERKVSLGLLAPPLPAATASGLIAGALGTSGVAGSAAAGTSAFGLAGSALTLKSVSIVGATLAVGLGGAKVADVDLTPGNGGGGPAAADTAGAGNTPGGAANGASQAKSTDNTGPAGQGSAAQDGSRRPAPEKAKADQQKKANKSERPAERPEGSQAQAESPGMGPQNAASNSNAGGASAFAPAGSGKPETPPGQINSSHSSASGSTGTPGNSASAGNGSPAHSNAGGSPPSHSNAGGNSAKPEK